jgi:hypothetical protein
MLLLVLWLVVLLLEAIWPRRLHVGKSDHVDANTLGKLSPQLTAQTIPASNVPNTMVVGLTWPDFPSQTVPMHSCAYSTEIPATMELNVSTYLIFINRPDFCDTTIANIRASGLWVFKPFGPQLERH